MTQRPLSAAGHLGLLALSFALCLLGLLAVRLLT